MHHNPVQVQNHPSGNEDLLCEVVGGLLLIEEHQEQARGLGISEIYQSLTRPLTDASEKLTIHCWHRFGAPQ